MNSSSFFFGENYLNKKEECDANTNEGIFFFSRMVSQIGVSNLVGKPQFCRDELSKSVKSMAEQEY